MIECVLLFDQKDDLLFETCIFQPALLAWPFFFLTGEGKNTGVEIQIFDMVWYVNLHAY